MYIIVLYVTLIVLLIAVYRSALILLNYRKVRRELKNSLEWPSVMGKITSSNVEEGVWYSRTKGNTSIYYPEINYLYTVMGKEYDGNRVMFASNIGTPNRKEAYNLLKRYPENTAVKIYYDPHGPSSSVIERELTEHYKKVVSRETVKLVAGIILFMMVGLYIVISL